jgi:hypothetical protein
MNENLDPTANNYNLEDSDIEESFVLYPLMILLDKIKFRKSKGFVQTANQI